MQSKPKRPVGVTILAVLSILSGLALVGGGGLALASPSTFASQLNVSTTFSQAFGAVLLILGLIYLALGGGFVMGKGWAWTLGLASYIIGIILTIAQIGLNPSGNLPGNIVGIIFAIIIIYYLTRPHIKAWFGKGAGAAAPMTPPSAGMTSPTMAASSMGGTLRCSNCGASVPTGSTKCPSCGAPL